MLVNLHVKNLALIEEADINFSEGLNIITGETGAGKSILIGSINAALGNKVNSEFVRAGAEYGLVELLFHVSDEHIIEELKEMDVPQAESGEILITRKIMPARSIIKVNGESKVASEVKKITALLIDIHGQHEHQSLLNPAGYIPIIDKYAKDSIKDVKAELKQEYDKFRACKKEYDEYNLDPEALKREMAFMEYEISEIDAASLKTGEDEELEQAFRKYNNSRKIMDAMTAAANCLSQSQPNAADQISYAYKTVSQIAEYDSEALSGILSQLADLEDIMNGLNSDIDSYISGMDYDEEDYRKADERLSLINNLKAKYGKTIADILEYRNQRLEKYESYISYEENKKKAKEQLDKSKETVLLICKKLTALRCEAAKSLALDIKNALLELNFLDVLFDIQINEMDNFTENGNNSAEFLISTNPGEPVRALSKVASGGELSRIMLAIKTVLSDKDAIETLIFDEIDTGISGRTAQMVAVKLSEISRNHQVLCITHLPQIASMADVHFMIEKNAVDGKTKTTIEHLDYSESVDELARLLGGSSITEHVLENAKEMKDLASKAKKY